MDAIKNHSSSAERDDVNNLQPPIKNKYLQPPTALSLPKTYCLPSAILRALSKQALCRVLHEKLKAIGPRSSLRRGGGELRNLKL